MKDLIINALNDAVVVLDKQVPLTKIKTIDVDISDVRPIDLPIFMKHNDIPDNAFIRGVDNGYDGYNDFVLSYNVDVDTSDSDKLKYKRRIFSNIAFKRVYDSLTSNGYKRVGFNSGLLSKFDDTTIYDMYINKDFDRLVDYYSLYFIKQ